MFKYRKGLFISLLIGLTLSSSLSEATVPNAPGSYVGISKLSNTSVRISTKDNSDNEDGFYVSVYDYETSNLVQRKQISDSNNSHIYADFTGLVCDKLYLANVLAFNEDGNSSVSDTRNFNIHTTFSTTCPDDIDVPTAPGSYIGVTDINKSAVRVNFLDNSDNEDGFLLFDESGDINVTVPANNATAPSQTYVTLTGLTCDRTYTIKALAFNTNGNSATSDSQTFNIHTTFGVSCDDILLRTFRCKEDEIRIIQHYGIRDDFSTINGIENTHPNPITALLEHLVKYNKHVKSDFATYDNQHINRLFLEDIKNLPTNIQSGRFYIGLRGNGELQDNDTMSIGDFTDTEIPTSRYSKALTDLSEDNWKKIGSNIYWNNFSNITFHDGQTLKDYVQTHSRFDTYVQDDTSVDFITIATCSTPDNCGKDVEIDLSQLANWTNKPNDAVENNVFNDTQYQGVWDDTLNWFDFVNSHSDEVLEIPFCACGNTLVDIKNFKADNNATIKLDSTLVVSQQGDDQEAMRRDDMGGNHVDGSKSITGTGTGVNHTLRVDVHNVGSEFGVAIDGTLKFRGNLGLCFKKPIDNDDKE